MGAPTLLQTSVNNALYRARGSKHSASFTTCHAGCLCVHHSNSCTEPQSPHALHTMLCAVIAYYIFKSKWCVAIADLEQCTCRLRMAANMGTSATDVDMLFNADEQLCKPRAPGQPERRCGRVVIWANKLWGQLAAFPPPPAGHK